LISSGTGNSKSHKTPTKVKRKVKSGHKSMRHRRRRPFRRGNQQGSRGRRRPNGKSSREGYSGRQLTSASDTHQQYAMSHQSYLQSDEQVVEIDVDRINEADHFLPTRLPNSQEFHSVIPT